jgi:hypothetical protein
MEKQNVVFVEKRSRGFGSCEILEKKISFLRRRRFFIYSHNDEQEREKELLTD